MTYNQPPGGQPWPQQGQPYPQESQYAPPGYQQPGYPSPGYPQQQYPPGYPPPGGGPLDAAMASGTLCAVNTSGTSARTAGGSDAMAATVASANGSVNPGWR